MFFHEKTLEIPVQVTEPNPYYAGMVLEQFGGANGELKACLQYFTQSFGVENPILRDLLMDISTEEISHLELVGTVISQFLAPLRQEVARHPSSSERLAQREADALTHAGGTAHKAFVLGGGGPLLADSSGTPFTGNFINSTGDLAADISSDFAAELRAKHVYEMLHRAIPDRGARDVFDFLIQREEAHSALFKEALEMAEDLGVRRHRQQDTEFSCRYPALSKPGSEGAPFNNVTAGKPPIRGPLTADQVRVGLAEFKQDGIKDYV